MTTINQLQQPLPLTSAIQINDREDYDIRAKNAGEPVFQGYNLRELRTEGGQGKGRWTGIYTRGTETSYIKRGNYLGDNVAEVVGSRVLGLVIGKQALQYDFIRNLREEDGENYLVSEFRDGFETLGARVRRSPEGRGRGWLGANPLTTENKRRIYNAIPEALRLDAAKVKAASLFALDTDGQIDNLFFYNERGDGVIRQRMGKYDNGWSLAGICKDKHAVIRLFEPRSFWGNRATHRHAPLPTNHFNDYPEIIHSENFLKAIDEVVKKADDDLQNSRCNVVTKALQEVANNYNKNSNETRRAFQAFARHIGLTIPVTLTQPNALRKFIEEKLTARLRERASSMALVRSLLNIKLKLQNNTVTVADLEAVKQVISQRFNGKKAVDFMPSDFEPSVKTLLEDALVATRTEDNRSRELMSFIDGLIQHPEKVIHAIAPSQRRLFAMMPSFNRFTRQPLVNLGLSIPALAGVALRARGSH